MRDIFEKYSQEKVIKLFHHVRDFYLNSSAMRMTFDEEILAAILEKIKDKV